MKNISFKSGSKSGSKSSYKYIFILKILLSIVFLWVILYLFFVSRLHSDVDEQKILFVVDVSEDDLAAHKAAMLALLDAWNKNSIENYSVGVVSFAGLSEIEVPFVKDRFLLQQYIEALELEENFKWADIKRLKVLLDRIKADTVIVFSDREEILTLDGVLRPEDAVNLLEPTWIHLSKYWNSTFSFLLVFLLVLLV